MSDPSKIEELKRRVDKDPKSIVFAQLAEEYRRAGQCEEAVRVCRAGLVAHPGYLSARVTLGRALLKLGRLDEAQLELHAVLVSAPDNLAAVRSLAEIFHRRGESASALSYYHQALSLAGNDRELQQTVATLTRDLANETASASNSEPPPASVAAVHTSSTGSEPQSAARIALPHELPLPLPVDEQPQSAETAATDDVERQHALRTIAALEQWLTALNGPGADRHP